LGFTCERFKMEAEKEEVIREVVGGEVDSSTIVSREVAAKRRT